MTMHVGLALGLANLCGLMALMTALRAAKHWWLANYRALSAPVYRPMLEGY